MNFTSVIIPAGKVRVKEGFAKKGDVFLNLKYFATGQTTWTPVSEEDLVEGSIWEDYEILLRDYWDTLDDEKKLQLWEARVKGLGRFFEVLNCFAIDSNQPSLIPSLSEFHLAVHKQMMWEFGQLPS